MTTHLRRNGPTAKLQHLVFYVRDITQAKAFYEDVLDLQFSALNHPDSSAAMRIAQQEMNFFSFGHYHHDICLVEHRTITPDNTSMLHFTVLARSAAAFDAAVAAVTLRGGAVRTGRMLASATPAPDTRYACFADPDGHWIELAGPMTDEVAA